MVGLHEHGYNALVELQLPGLITLCKGSVVWFEVDFHQLIRFQRMPRLSTALARTSKSSLFPSSKTAARPGNVDASFNTSQAFAWARAQSLALSSVTRAKANFQPFAICTRCFRPWFPNKPCVKVSWSMSYRSLDVAHARQVSSSAGRGESCAESIACHRGLDRWGIQRQRLSNGSEGRDEDGRGD